jgi:DNA adenine methylase
MSTSNFFTPLRYPGGKGKIADYIKEIITSNRLTDGIYVEPYAGGAAVAIELLLLDYVEEIQINDLNLGVYSFWNAVLNHSDQLIDKIEKTSVTIEEWYRQKTIQSTTSSSPLDIAFSTFFLNRCNRSGILKGGVIGGKNQNGKWKLDARFNKADLIERILQINRFRDRIVLHREDAANLVTSLAKQLPHNTLFYLDPPYYVKGKGLYDNFYNHDDHLKIAQVLKEIDQSKWVVSYDDVPEIRSIYENYRNLRYRLSYSAQRREQGGEVMFFCDTLIIPEVPESVPMYEAA